MEREKRIETKKPNTSTTEAAREETQPLEGRPLQRRTHLMGKKDLLFLGGLGAPTPVFAPWFLALKWFGFKIHVVRNSPLVWDPVTKFAESLLDTSSRLESFDVLGVSYGGNAALYGASLSPDFCEKVRKMVLVCAPVLGAPGLLKSLRVLMPGFMKKTLEEMDKSGEVVTRIREMALPERIPFDLHYIYHERDLIAPRETATLPGVGTAHALDFQWQVIPKLVMHQAASINPKTLDKVLKVLIGP